MKDLRREKETEYVNYIKEHQVNVLKGYTELETILKKYVEAMREYFGIDDITEVMNCIYPNILAHDLSKFSKDEFDAYRRKFHSINDKEKEYAKSDFEVAWNHHYTLNNHHWEHYRINPVLEEDEANDTDDNYKPMSIEALLELVCDWMGMGYKFGGSILDYYNKEYKKLHFEAGTRKILEFIMMAIVTDSQDKEFGTNTRVTIQDLDNSKFGIVNILHVLHDENDDEPDLDDIKPVS